ncbi:MAG: amidohydrolase family protein, partial [Acidimicrobiales bacterium]
MRTDPIISADDHMDLNVMPPDLFVGRLRSAYGARAPRVIETDDGPFWMLEGKRLRPSGRRGAGHVQESHGLRPGVPEHRLEDMDRDGVFCQIVYGPPGGFGFVDDVDLRAACYRAYND